MKTLPNRAWLWVHRIWGKTWEAEPRKDYEKAGRLDEQEYIRRDWLVEQIKARLNMLSQDIAALEELEEDAFSAVHARLVLTNILDLVEQSTIHDTGEET